MHRIVVLALPDVVAFDLAIPAQVFGHSDERERYAFEVCAARAGRVRTTTGFELAVARGLEALDDADTVIVPGYLADDEPSREVLDALRAAAGRGARMASICTGAFALAAAGVLDGLRATTHWRDAALLAERYPLVDVDPDVLYIDNGAVLSSAGVAAGIDLCLHLVRRDHGADAATRIARRMVVPPQREGGQAQFVERPLPEAGSALGAVRAWALERLSEPLTVGAMARRAGWAPRTFARMFRAQTGTTPLRWLTQQRLNESRRMLEATELSVEQIAASAGFGTAANLRLHFSRDLGTSPTAYRRAFGVEKTRHPASGGVTAGHRGNTSH